MLAPGAAAALAAPRAARVPAAAALASPAAAGGDSQLVAVIRSEQAALVRLAYLPRVQVDTTAVDITESAVMAGEAELRGDRSALATAQLALAAMEGKARYDSGALSRATSADTAARARMALDRERLQALAIGAYTGGVPGYVADGAGPLQVTQNEVFGQVEVASITETVVADLGADEVSARRAAAVLSQSRAQVATDAAQLGTDRQATASDQARIYLDVAELAASRKSLTAEQGRLATAVAAQDAALQAVTANHGQPAGLSILGGDALSAAQMAAWYTTSGYSDLAQATISQLTAWYSNQAVAEGVRGDVAFAQAVLETGGFTSPDAIVLNNYAGIGHCDLCAAGWAFPSPRMGVLGQLQLLRIFADPGATSARPGPALAALTAAKQFEHGCCGTWESLTGVWATDPNYGAQILSIYQQMLSQTLGSLGSAGPPPATTYG
jgi:hypothetical protein